MGTYNGNKSPVRVGYAYIASKYGASLPAVVALVGPGYRLWEFQFGYPNPSYLTAGYFYDAAGLGMQRGDIIFISGYPSYTAVAVTDVAINGAATLTADVATFMTSLRSTPISQSPSFGTLLTNWTVNTTFQNSGSLTDVVPCPDRSSPQILNMNVGGVAADPVGNGTTTGLSIPCNTVENVLVWAKATVRAGDAIAQAYPFQIFLGVGGLTKIAQITGLIPPDGNWHPLIFYKGNFAVSGGFSFSSTDIIDRIRIKPTDVSQNGAVGYNTATTGEVNVFGPVRINPRGRAKFLIRFDDSLGDLVNPTSTNTFSLPDGTPAPSAGWSGLTLLQHYGFRASCFHLPRRIGTSNNMATFLTWDELKILDNNGWANCFQTYYDPTNTTNDGIRLLGPFGYTSKSVASVDTSADTITASVATGMILLGVYYGGYPVIFSGTNLPSPLVINKVYWAAGANATAFYLYPTENDLINNTNRIDLTTTGTPANFTFRYGFSANDYTKYTEDWTLGIKMLTDNGYGEAAQYVALNQGATDGNVMTMAYNMGIKAVFGTYKSSDPTWFQASYPFAEAGGTNPAINWKGVMVIPATIQTDTAGLWTTQQVRQFVQNVVASGSLGMNFHHRINNANGAILAALLDELKIQSDAGLIDVITAPELPLN